MELEIHANETTAATTMTTPPPCESLEALLEAVAPPQRPAAMTGVVLGVLTGWSASGQPQVTFPGAPAAGALPALATVPLHADDVGREVALLFIESDAQRPLVVGLVQPPLANPTAAVVPVAAQVDGQRVEFTAEQEIVLRCGKASITLTRAGKVLIEGAYVLTRSSGVNRLKGGSVQIN